MDLAHGRSHCRKHQNADFANREVPKAVVWNKTANVDLSSAGTIKALWQQLEGKAPCQGQRRQPEVHMILKGLLLEHMVQHMLVQHKILKPQEVQPQEVHKILKPRKEEPRKDQAHNYLEQRGAL